MSDCLPQTALLMQWVEERARKVFELFGYSEIRTPILEATDLFTRAIGESTDIVEKEMYSFVDRSGKNVSLRPEGTAPIIRAYIENDLDKNVDVAKLFYIGPMFRGERPQKGRLRQFHQIGVEIIGIPKKGTYYNAELILNIKTVLHSLGIDEFVIYINSLGCGEDQERYKRVLAEFLSNEKMNLCENCGRRLTTNVLRVLDCKSESCRDVLKRSPNIIDYLCGDCSDDYKALKNHLQLLDIKNVEEKKLLVRGLDYYTGFIFEVAHKALGSQDAIAAGGRYDNLTKEMGGPDAGAVGYAIGVERLLLAIKKENFPVSRSSVLIIAVDEEARNEAFMVTNKLRGKGISCEMDYSERSLKSMLKKANKEQRKNIILIGSNELKEKKLLLKNMESGAQELMTLEEAVGKLI